MYLNVSKAPGAADEPPFGALDGAAEATGFFGAGALGAFFSYTRRIRSNSPHCKYGFTVRRAGGLAAGFLGAFAAGAGADVSSSSIGLAGGGGAFAATFFFGGAAGAGAAGGGAREGAGAPALALTVAFSNASFILTLRTSATPSRTALRGRSPTIFINVPKHVAASFRAPSKESSKRLVRVPAIGFI